MLLVRFLLLSVFLVLVMSMTCYILTIAVYIYVKELRNTLGKCVISSLFWSFVTDLICIVTFLLKTRVPCSEC